MPGLPLPPPWVVDDLRGLYVAAWNGGQVEFKDWVSRMTAFLREYPHLTASQMGIFVLEAGPALRNEPSLEQLRRLDLARREAETGYPGDFDRYVMAIVNLLIEYPHITASEVNRLRLEWVALSGGPVTLRPTAQDVEQRVAQPTDEELYYLDQDWVAAENGGRGEYNGYLLNLVEILSKYPHLKATQLKDLHRAHTGH